MAYREPFERVLAAAQADAPWAYERLYRTLSPSVCGYPRIQGAADPEDLTSEVFLGAFRGISAFAGDEGQFRSWVFTIAHRRLTDERRARVSAERVRSLCAVLAPDQADVLVLRLVSGLTVEAVAGVLAKTPGAVKALQRRGLCALRKELAREGVPL